MQFVGWIYFLHVTVAAAFVMTMIIMQLVVSRVMRYIPASPGKKEAVDFLQKRWLPIVDLIIILVGVSGLGLAYFFWVHVQSNSLLQIKIGTATIALAAAYLNHFYFRYKKRRLAASGHNPELLAKVGRLMGVLDKVALIGGALTALLGFYIVHV